MMNAQGDEASAEQVLDERTAIGITFGNSNSSIAVAYSYGEGKAEVIANEEGDRHIPSILSYVNGEEYHGTQAKSHLVRNSKITVAYFRDFLGKDFKAIDPSACHASAHPQEHGSDVAFSLHETTEDTTSLVSESEIASRHLRRLTSSAIDFLGKSVTGAVLTVPTDFTEQQREALRTAAKDAGIDVLQFIPEPIAALLAYDARSQAKLADKIVVVADLGGTRSDVAVVASRGGLYTILATAHDYSLGGAQLDQVLIDYFAKEFIKKHKTDPRENARSLAKLKLETEATKKALSLGTSAALSVESLADGVDFSSTINRSRYEILAAKVFGSFTRLIEGVVKKAGLDLLEIDEVILSGGTSHTPKIARNIEALFPSTTSVLSPPTSTTAINPSDLSARGAAIQASLIHEFESEDVEQSTHPAVTATPHLAKAIGIILPDTSGGLKEPGFQPLLFANTALPARRTAIFSSGGGDVLVKLCEAAHEIKVTKVEAPPRTKGAGSDSEDDLDSDEDDEETENREKVWHIGAALAEAAVRETKKGSNIEVMANVGADSKVQFTVREVGAKSGLRIELKGHVTENGKI